ncbi:MAG: response regulator [Bdellovibrionales bacterium]|nr:response regulator [Bdellovibrionales bacterium]
MAKILLCDDNKTILTLFERRFQESGHEIVGKARDGDEGIKLYRELKPDLVLLDITMPNKDGRECLAEILGIDPSARVVMLTGLMDEAVKKDCLARGARAFISKSKSSASLEDFRANVLSVIDPILKAA